MQVSRISQSGLNKAATLIPGTDHQLIDASGGPMLIGGGSSETSATPGISRNRSATSSSPDPVIDPIASNTLSTEKPFPFASFSTSLIGLSPDVVITHFLCLAIVYLDNINIFAGSMLPANISLAQLALMVPVPVQRRLAKRGTAAVWLSPATFSTG